MNRGTLVAAALTVIGVAVAAVSAAMLSWWLLGLAAGTAAAAAGLLVEWEEIV